MKESKSKIISVSKIAYDLLNQRKKAISGSGINTSINQIASQAIINQLQEG